MNPLELRVQKLEEELARLKEVIVITPNEVAINSGMHIRGNLTLNGVKILVGSGSPSSIPAPTGSLYMNRTGGGGSTFYVKVAGAWFGET